MTMETMFVRDKDMLELACSLGGGLVVESEGGNPLPA
jgi:hypothetical protein